MLPYDPLKTRPSTKDIALKLAYMLGVYSKTLELQYENSDAVLTQMRTSEPATVIRKLCKIRKSMILNYSQIDIGIQDLRNIGVQDKYFNLGDIKWLAERKINVVLHNQKAFAHLHNVNELIAQKIDGCKNLFPNWVEWSYIKYLFIIPKGERPNSVDKNECTFYRNNMRMYPFETYLRWNSPTGEHGNVLFSDLKILKTAYANFNKNFCDYDLVLGANLKTRSNIQSFIENHEKIAVVVDCENADVYKLAAVLKNLSAEEREVIDKIVLYDDINTTAVWQILKNFTNIPVEHKTCERVSDRKSLVDINLTVGVTRDFYENQIKAFILVSSDSDFTGLINAFPQADFLTLAEESKIGAALKSAIAADGKYCLIDDFCQGHIEDLKKIALLSSLERQLSSLMPVVSTDSLIDAITADCRIALSDSEKTAFINKYIAKIKLFFDADGYLKLTANGKGK